ncbi:hypothetical protein GCM10018790_81210 [Kitasatospora xanthocidica]|nr:hypothetical protein GCM10018790_81210 [Kitasatospora xanthocidica]
MICAFKRDSALCEPAPGANAPRQYDCRPGCANTVRTDTHARLPSPVGRRLRTSSDRLRTTAATHDSTAQTAEALR